MGRTVLLLMVLATTLLMTSGVAWAAVSEVGGPGDDAIVGTEGADALAGGGGSDRVSGGGGDDFMDGGPPATPTTPPAREVPPNADLIMGGSGEDDIDGNLGPDRIVGGSGDDFLADGENGGGEVDLLMGGEGDDALLPGNEPAAKDVALCGPGNDVVFADRTDVVVGCERVLFRPPMPADFQ